MQYFIKVKENIYETPAEALQYKLQQISLGDRTAYTITSKLISHEGIVQHLIKMELVDLCKVAHRASGNGETLRYNFLKNTIYTSINQRLYNTLDEAQDDGIPF